jgi:hypothetical protein
MWRRRSGKDDVFMGQVTKGSRICNEIDALPDMQNFSEVQFFQKRS